MENLLSKAIELDEGVDDLLVRYARLLAVARAAAEHLDAQDYTSPIGGKEADKLAEALAAVEDLL